jgi:hypothetical protein
MPDHLARVLRRVAEQPALPVDRDNVLGRLRRLCGAAAQELSASGAALTVLAEGGLCGLMAASDPLSERIEELELLLGEGPRVDALATRRPVLVSDLGAAAMRRWPFYSASVHDDGVRAVFAFPLQVGGAQLGVLVVFRAYAGPLSADELAQTFAFAEVAVNVLLDGLDDAMAGTAIDGLDEAVEHNAALFQAQGMVMVQLGITLVEALTRMRAHAFAENRRLIDVAHDIVARTMLFEPDR